MYGLCFRGKVKETMATYDYAYDMTVPNTTTANIYTKSTDDGFRPYDDISVMVNGKDINVGATLAELDLYKTVFTEAFSELGIDINEIVEKTKFLDKLSS